MSCKVQGCRFKFTHTTRGHLCSKCKQYGHGRIECGKAHELNSFYNEILPSNKQCSFSNCKYKEYHTNDAHHCKKCLQNHSIHECPQINFRLNVRLNERITVKCPLCRTDNDIILGKGKGKGKGQGKGKGKGKNDKGKNDKGKNDTCCVCLIAEANVVFPKCLHICCCFQCVKKLNKNDDIKSYNLFNEILNEGNMETYCDIKQVKQLLSKSMESKIYTKSYAGMGCVLFIRRDFIDGDLLGFFLHSDCQGQYGVNHMPFVDKFIDGYKYCQMNE